MFTADVAVEDHDELAQDSFCVLAHSGGKFSRVVDFRISTTAPAVGHSRLPPKTSKTTMMYLPYISYGKLVSCTNPKNRKKMPRLALVRTCFSTAVKLLLRYRTGKIKSNTLEPHFETSVTMSQSLEVTKTAVASPHGSEST